MANLSVDRLTLQLPGLSEGDGRRLLRLIAEGLSTAEPVVPGRTRDALSMSLGRQPQEALESLAARIVEELMRTLARSP